MKNLLTIAGSDCSGGAGIQADLKTFAAHGTFGMSVIVSIVAENTARVIDIQDVTPDMIEKQMDAVFEDIFPDAVKIGMLSTPECMQAVAGKLKEYKPQNIVIDPVMYAKNGCALMQPYAIDTLIKTIIPLADVLTPNIPEAEKIAEMKIETVATSVTLWTCCTTARIFTTLKQNASKQKTRTAQAARFHPPLRQIWLTA